MKLILLIQYKADIIIIISKNNLFFQLINYLLGFETTITTLFSLVFLSADFLFFFLGKIFRNKMCQTLSQQHRCQPLRFFRNCYEFRAKITVLRSTVYLLRISDYCRPGTVLHLNIIVIIQTLHCMLKSRNDKRLRDFDYLILQGFSGLSIVENDLSISCLIPSS